MLNLWKWSSSSQVFRYEGTVSLNNRSCLTRPSMSQSSYTESPSEDKLSLSLIFTDIHMQLLIVESKFSNRWDYTPNLSNNVWSICAVAMISCLYLLSWNPDYLSILNVSLIIAKIDFPSNQRQTLLCIAYSTLCRSSICFHISVHFSGLFLFFKSKLSCDDLTVLQQFDCPAGALHQGPDWIFGLIFLELSLHLFIGFSLPSERVFAFSLLPPSHSNLTWQEISTRE
jgi:hypothetical protein